MPDGFVPLSTGRPQGAQADPFRITLLSEAQAPATPFQPAVPRAEPAPESPSHSHSSSTQVSVLRDGERITGIRIHCSCGEILSLDCHY